MLRLTRAWVATVAAAGVVASAHAADAAPFSKLVEMHGQALVTVKFIPQRPDGQKGSEVETPGIMISADGLVLCANSRIGGNPMGGPGITPTDIEIVFGEATDGLAAEVVGRDTELDLAWVKITADLPEPPAFIDLNKSTRPAIGDHVYALRLMDRFYGRIPFVKPYQISALPTKPRDLIAPTVVWMTDSDYVGTPTFTADGELVGMLIVQLPDPAALQGGQRPSDLIFILPAKRIATQTELALEQYAERKVEEAAAAAVAAPAETPAETTPSAAGTDGD
jgi:S1-C subfamily serine protease